MTLKLLAVGDMHLGNQPSRLPPELKSEAKLLSPAGAWARLVETAIAEQVNIVALAGDVVAQDDDYFEAYSELSRGVAQLASAGIKVVGIAGNHDVDVLPRLAKEIPHFQLIGDGGKWESVSFSEGTDNLTIHGWSFPTKKIFHSPIGGHKFDKGDGVNIGLLHCDRDQSGSSYAPVMSSEFATTGLDAWLLGHIHVPDHLSVDSPSGYLGCVSGVDPGESGPRGPWLYTISNDRISDVQQWLLAPMHWQALRLDLTDIAHPDEAQGLLLQQLKLLSTQLAARQQPPKATAIRLTLTGHSDHGPAALARLATQIGSVALDDSQGARFFLEHCQSLVRPGYSLENLAQRQDLPGLLARRLLCLDEPESTAAQELIEEGRQRLVAQQTSVHFSQLEADNLSDNEVIDWLQQAGNQMLHSLLAQQPGATS